MISVVTFVLVGLFAILTIRSYLRLQQVSGRVANLRQQVSALEATPLPRQTIESEE